MTDDTGHAIAYHALKRGTSVRSADGQLVGRVRRVSIAARENIFDGIDIDTADGQRFVDAPEVERIYERMVELNIDAARVAELPRSANPVAERVKMSSPARRMQRFGRNLKERWGRR